MKFACTSVIAAMTLSALLSGCNSDQKKKETAAEPAVMEPAKPLTVSDSASVSVMAKVRAVNQATRKVTLEDDMGRSVEIVAGPEIKRLHEVQVGDSVKVEYVASVLAELRPPTADEAANPIALVAVTSRTRDGATPAGATAMGTRVVTTVVTVDVPNMRVTLKGPMGDMTTVRARNPENIRKLSPGDTIVITYSEGLAISLVKAGSK